MSEHYIQCNTCGANVYNANINENSARGHVCDCFKDCLYESAPELLEALKRCLYDDAGDLEPETVYLAMEAIKKAEGETK